MMKLMGAKRKDRDKVGRLDSDKKWWKFSRKTKVKPIRALDIQHNVNFNENHDEDAECYEMSKYVDRDNNHYRLVVSACDLDVVVLSEKTFVRSETLISFWFEPCE